MTSKAMRSKNIFGRFGFPVFQTDPIPKTGPIPETGPVEKQTFETQNFPETFPKLFSKLFAKLKIETPVQK